MPTAPREFDEWKRHAVYLRDGYKCAYSGYVDKTYTGKRLSLDHIVPIHKGGALQNKRDEPATNLTTAHAPTNFAKADRTQEQWSAYAKDIVPPKRGLKFEWHEIEKGASPPPELDIARGKELAKLAEQARAARGLDERGKRTVETKKSRDIAKRSAEIVASYQAEQRANKAEAEKKEQKEPEKKEGPGVQHDPDNGRFAPASAAALSASRHARALSALGAPTASRAHIAAAARQIALLSVESLIVAAAHLLAAAASLVGASDAPTER